MTTKKLSIIHITKDVELDRFIHLVGYCACEVFFEACHGCIAYKVPTDKNTVSSTKIVLWKNSKERMILAKELYFIAHCLIQHPSCLCHCNTV